MGMFSWLTADTGESIRIFDPGRFAVYLHLPDGRIIEEPDYGGYGDFCGRDFFGLVVEINDVVRPRRKVYALEFAFDKRWRGLGIDMYYGEVVAGVRSHRGLNAAQFKRLQRALKLGLKFPRIARYPSTWEQLPDNKRCPDQGFM